MPWIAPRSVVLQNPGKIPGLLPRASLQTIRKPVNDLIALREANPGRRVFVALTLPRLQVKAGFEITSTGEVGIQAALQPAQHVIGNGADLDTYLQALKNLVGGSPQAMRNVQLAIAFIDRKP